MNNPTLAARRRRRSTWNVAIRAGIFCSRFFLPEPSLFFAFVYSLVWQARVHRAIKVHVRHIAR